MLSLSSFAVTSSMHVVLPAVETINNMVQIVAQNPIAYYNLVDYASRTCGRCTVDLQLFLALGLCMLLPRGCSRVWSKQLFTSKQHVKAYISAVASWVKALILTLGAEPQAAASGTGGGQQVGSERWVRMIVCMGAGLDDLQTARRDSTSSGSAEPQQEDSADGSAYVRTAELNMLLWVSRAVQVVAHRLLHHLTAEEEQQDLASSSSSRNGVAAVSEGTSSSRVDGVSSASSNSRLASSVGGDSSSCDVASHQVNSSIACYGSSSPGADGAVRGSSSSGAGACEGSHATSTAAQGSSGGSTKASSSGGVCSGGESQSLIEAASSVCVTGTTVALMLHRGLKQWSAVQGAGVDTATSAAEVPLAAAAAGAAPADDVPSRLSRQLREGLPIAVVEQLQECSNRWPAGEGSSSSSSNSSERLPLSEEQTPKESSCSLVKPTSNSSVSSSTNRRTSSRDPLEDKEVQRLVLGDVIKLCQVLQQEVPTIVGCNNPTCLNLRGMLESAASRKVCTGCNVGIVRWSIGRSTW